MPLWILFVGVQFADVLWAVFVLLGVEKARVVEGFTEASYLDLYHMPYSHSLTASIGWSVIVLSVYHWGKKNRGWNGSSLTLAAAVLSHWCLDLLVHIEDLPLNGELNKVGFGIWRSLPLSLAVEAVTLLVPLWWCAKGRPNARRYLALGVLLCMSHAYYVFGPTPPSIQVVAVMALGAFIGLAFAAYWVEREHPKAGT